jgi:hypothetical protein
MSSLIANVRVGISMGMVDPGMGRALGGDRISAADTEDDEGKGSEGHVRGSPRTTRGARMPRLLDVPAAS